MGFGWFFGSFSERRFAAMSHIAELGRTEGGDHQKRGKRGKKEGKGGKGKKRKKGEKEKKGQRRGKWEKKGKKRKRKAKGGKKKKGKKRKLFGGGKCLEQQMRWKIGKEKLCRFGE